MCQNISKISLWEYILVENNHRQNPVDMFKNLKTQIVHLASVSFLKPSFQLHFPLIMLLESEVEHLVLQNKPLPFLVF